MSNNCENNELHKELIAKAIAAKDNSYSPYSKFRVGAALLTEDNKIFTGCNVENASYGLTICAERTALVKAVSEGHQKFTEIAISSDLKDKYISPCGACRQFISEFGLDWNITCIRNADDYKTFKVKEMLPYAFGSDELNPEQRLVQ